MLKSGMHYLVKFLRDEEGPTAVEYAVMLALVIVVCLLSIATVGLNTQKVYVRVNNAMAGTSGS